MIHKELEEKMEQMIESLGCNLYDIVFLKENNTDILRVSIIKKEGSVTLDMCQEVSESISPLLDVYDPLSGKYTLEVSSPGIERVLKIPRHFQYSIGQEVFVRTDDKEEFEAILKSTDDKGAVFETQEGEKFFAFDALKKVKTIFRW